MTVRLATIDDVEAIHDHAAGPLLATTMLDFPVINHAKVRATITDAVLRGLCWVAVAEDAVVGSICLQWQEHWFADRPFLSDLWIYVNRPWRKGTGAGLKLLRRAIGCAKERRATLLLGIMRDDETKDEVGRLYERLGLKRLGGYFVMGY